MICVLIVDDEVLVCAGLWMILLVVDDLEVVVEVEDGVDVVEVVCVHRSDVVFMDIWMLWLDGLCAT